MVYSFFRPIAAPSLALKALTRYLLPGQCLFCGAHTTSAPDICSACHDSLPWLPPACSRCALPISAPEDNDLCGQCLTQLPHFHRTEACWLYQPPVSQVVATFKYRRNLSYGHSLSILLAERIVSAYYETPLPDIITAVPLHRWRYLQRGFNQSEAIATQLDRELGLPYQRLLKRSRATISQQTLDAGNRQKNLRNAFHCIKSLAGQSVALVDDVMTTGATANEISRTLLDAGAAEVHIWCLARTLIHR